jgi:hypothetical protein
MRSVFLEHENPHAFKELKQNLDCTMIGQQSVPHICLRFPSTRSFATTCYTWTTSQVFHLGLIGKVWLQQDRATHILISVCTSTSVTCSRQVNWQWLVTITCPFGWVYQTPFVLWLCCECLPDRKRQGHITTHFSNWKKLSVICLLPHCGSAMSIPPLHVEHIILCYRNSSTCSHSGCINRTILLLWCLISSPYVYSTQINSIYVYHINISGGDVTFWPLCTKLCMLYVSTNKR